MTVSIEKIPPALPPMVYVGLELPWLPQRLVDKILAADYVDFNKLPQRDKYAWEAINDGG